MLRELSIRNLAIVTSAELELGQGMVVLTGETGAGKSILIDALSLALGGKADKRMIRHGQARAEVSAGFRVAPDSPAAAWLREHELDSDDECILRRVLNQDGRSRAFVNGSPAPRKALQEIGALLVAIHGQHAHQALTRPTHQRLLLDRFGGHARLLERIARCYQALQRSQRRLDELRAAADERAARAELLRYQIDELDALAIGDDEWPRLDEAQRRLSRADQLRDGVARVLTRIAGDDQGLRDPLNDAARQLRALAASDPTLGDSAELLESASIQIEEAASGLRHYLDGLELDPARLAEVETRLGQLLDMARKYRVEPTRLNAHRDTLATELATLRQHDDDSARLAEETARLQAEYQRAAEQLSKKREAAARKLARIVTQSMETLAMRGGRFEIRLSPAEPGANGIDQIEFRVSANPGQPPAPLAAVASGGELSRISLAIQTATAGCDDIPSLIFDEIDVGIGGGTASIVGRLLHQLAQQRQVICITHLPQVAAHGDQHLAVAKAARDGQTTTTIRPLKPRQRIEELARMLGGEKITPKARDNARELLRQTGALPESPAQADRPR